jgi:type VI secretion system protein ImpA
MSLGSLASALKTRSDSVPDFLCAPIPGPRPAGQEVRYAGDYDAIVEARRSDNAALPQGVWQRELKRADWTEVERLCIETLTTRAKDLQVASWLTEAWINRRGFAGLEAGLGLLCRLCDRYWPELYPGIEDGDLSPRLAPLEWLNEKVPDLLRALPIVCSAADPDERFAWADYVNAQRLETVRQRDPGAAERAEAAGAVTLARFGACRQRTETAALKQTEAALKQALSALAALNDVLQKQCGKDAPGLAAIRSVLDEILAFATAELTGRGKPAAPLAFLSRKRAPTSPDTVPSAQPLATSVTAPAPRTREDAYRELSEIAEFLLRVEPHSPTPYVLQRAAAWGDLPLPELIQQLSQSGSDLSRLLAALGLLQQSTEIAENDGASE